MNPRRTIVASGCPVLLIICLALPPAAWGLDQGSPKTTTRSPEERRKPETEVAPEDWSYQFQATVVLQGRGAMDSPYAGPNSFSADRGPVSIFGLRVHVGF